VPTRLDFAEARVEGGAIRVRFSGEGASGAVIVERSVAESSDPWTVLGDATEVSPRMYEYLDASVVAGESYRYRARWWSDGVEQVTEPSAPVGLALSAPVLALRARDGSVGRGWPVMLEAQVPAAGVARIELVDVTGRVVGRRMVENTGGRSFTVSLAPLHPAAGLYFARLVQGDRVTTLRLVRL
jgi:hypothetical protein